MNLEPYTKHFSVVMVGGFNPNNYQLHRLSKLDLVSQKDCDDAKVIANGKNLQITFPWTELVVTHDRLMLSTSSDEYLHVFKDLLISLVSIFETTAVTGVGINGRYTYALNNEKDWHKLGHYLVPKESWKTALDDTKCNIGTNNVRVQVDDYINEPTKGILNIELRPILNDEKDYVKNSILIGYNCHFNTDETKIGLVINIIESNLDFLFKNYLTISNNIIDGAINK
ncbi:hypothetical protein [Shewanella algae]|uniref:hypothetical protein n=1 Tax=Shewanella algae TaxID=38313 RepID=UPI0026592BEA|nr:hypothetical protein [Shewanella algae]WKC42245.1 hypothetical protein QYM03_01855 [Shewanella algae]